MTAIFDSEPKVKQAGDTPEERAAFLKWWEGEASWSGSPCAVAYAGWLAARACPSVVNSDDAARIRAALDVLGHGPKSSHAGYNLDGALTDLTRDKADPVCIKTITRVRDQISVAMRLLEGSESPPTNRGVS